MPRAFCYARASTDEQADTILAQVQACTKEWGHRFKASHEWGGEFTDRGVSGGTPLRQRPQGFKLSLELGPGDLVLIAKLDRGFRSCVDALQTHQHWKAKGVRLVLLDLGMDTGTPAGEAMLGVMAVFAQFERSRMSERRKEVNAVRRAQGRPVNQHAGYGFRVVGKPGQKVKVPDTYTRAVGRQIVEWMDAGWGREAIWRHLNQKGVLTRDGRQWKPSTIDRTYRAEKALQEQEQTQRGGST